MVADQLAAKAGEDWRAMGETCPLLLAASGGKQSNAAAVWEQGAAYCGLADATRVALVLADENPTNKIGRQSGRVSTETAKSGIGLTLAAPRRGGRDQLLITASTIQGDGRNEG